MTRKALKFSVAVVSLLAAAMLVSGCGTSNKEGTSTGVVAKVDEASCAQCHTQDYCLDCHQGGGINADLSTATFGRDYHPKNHRTDFLSIHPIKALDNPQNCTRCHDQSFCNSCHTRFPKGSLRIKSHQMLGANGQRYAPAINEHATEARRNLQSCQSCHPEGDVCIQCHASGKTNPHPRNWKDISGNIRNRGGNKVCLKCHLPGSF